MLIMQDWLQKRQRKMENEIENIITEENSSDKPVFYDDNCIAAYDAFKEQVYNPKSVLYACCGLDGSPAMSFNNVTFVDDEKMGALCIKKLQEVGLNAIKTDIRDYKTIDLHDLLILYNPQIEDNEWATRHLKIGGYILINDHLNNATRMHREPEKYQVYGTIEYDKNNILVSRDLKDLFETIKNQEELEKYNPKIYEAISKSRHNKSFEEAFTQHKERIGLPYKREPEWYIFIKK
jgi:hypothetical protein